MVEMEEMIKQSFLARSSTEKTGEEEVIGDEEKKKTLLKAEKKIEPTNMEVNVKEKEKEVNAKEEGGGQNPRRKTNFRSLVEWMMNPLSIYVGLASI